MYDNEHEEGISTRLSIAASEMYMQPLFRKAHDNARRLTERAGLAMGLQATMVGLYSDRRESVIEPLDWRVGNTEFTVYPMLITEYAGNVVDATSFREVRSTEWGPLAKTIWLALGSGVPLSNKHFEKALLEEHGLPWFEPDREQWDSSMVNGLHLCVRPNREEHALPFLRIPIMFWELPCVVSGDSRKFISYLRFWDQGYPKPYGNGESRPV